MSLTFKIEKIGPKRAYEMLETMDSNRRIRQSGVDEWASTMKAGLWVLTHQGIAFDEDGRLVDGQHRLWAIIETEMVIEMVVCHGLTKAAVAALDRGKSRSFADTAKYMGSDAGAAQSTIAKILAVGIYSAYKSVPAERVMGWINFYRSEVDFAVAARAQTIVVGKKFTFPMAAALARASSTVDAIRLERFLEVVRSGIVAGEYERSALAFRDAWISGRLGSDNHDQYFKTSGALRQFVTGRAGKHIQRPEGEVFPLKDLPKELRYDFRQARASPRSGTHVRSEFLLAHSARCA